MSLNTSCQRILRELLMIILFHTIQANIFFQTFPLAFRYLSQSWLSNIFASSNLRTFPMGSPISLFSFLIHFILLLPFVLVYFCLCTQRNSFSPLRGILFPVNKNHLNILSGILSKHLEKYIYFYDVFRADFYQLQIMNLSSFLAVWTFSCFSTVS